MRLLPKILILFALVKPFSLLCQDLHFSQFNGSLLNLSPGFVGFYDGDYRIGAIYRSQWQSVPVRYNTVSLHGEKVISPLALKKDLIGVGFLFNSDRAGDARYGTTQAYLSGSYIVKSFADTSIRLSIGASLGWVQVGFDYSKMTFDSQYDGFTFNSSLSGNEHFLWTQRNFLDVNTGFVIQKRYLSHSQLSYAFGLYHLTNPGISYQGNDNSRLDYKFSNTLSYVWAFNNHLDILMEALFSVQGKYKELIPHASLKFYFDRSENKAILGGLSFRTKDAVILRLGYTNKAMQAGIAYDVNISRFTAATNMRGGFEIFINQIINVKPGFVARKKSCPVFM